jgi:hypothetical protein
MCDSLPWEGVGRGFIDRLICFKWRINPSLPLRNPAAPLPREGIKNLPNTYGVVTNNICSSACHGNVIKNNLFIEK